MASSEIEWTEATWNPMAGCTMVSPGCTNCYAMRMAARLEAMGQSKYRGTTRRSGSRAVWSGQINFDKWRVEAPLTRSRPQRIFVNSMSDLFHEDVKVEFIRQIWEIMQRAHWHTFQILTKRPTRMRDVTVQGRFPVLPNVWLGTSVENADYVWRIDCLRSIPASVRFISFEPLIGPVGRVDLTGIHWAIVGGESGPAARPMDVNWVHDVRMACTEKRVPFFFKQWGGTRKKKTGRLLDGEIWEEYPRSTRPDGGPPLLGRALVASANTASAKCIG
jgi:protein gp37